MLDFTNKRIQLNVSHKDGNAKTYSENIGYWVVSSSDTMVSMATSWDNVGRGIANLLTDSYNDVTGKIEISANEVLG